MVPISKTSMKNVTMGILLQTTAAPIAKWIKDIYVLEVQVVVMIHVSYKYIKKKKTHIKININSAKMALEKATSSVMMQLLPMTGVAVKHVQYCLIGCVLEVLPQAKMYALKSH